MGCSITKGEKNVKVQEVLDETVKGGGKIVIGGKVMEENKGY
jgi:F0F1-type ATP synthase delta subunit